MSEWNYIYFTMICSVFEGWIHRDCLFCGIPMYFTMIRAAIRLEFEVCGNAGCLIWWIWIDYDRFGVFLRVRYIGIAYFCGVPMYFTMIRAEIRLEFRLSGNAGCLIWYVWRRWYIGIAIICRVPMYSFLGYIGIWYSCWIPMYPEYMVFGTYIGNATI